MCKGMTCTNSVIMQKKCFTPFVSSIDLIFVRSCLDKVTPYFHLQPRNPPPVCILY